jgi:hypothetical protein
LQDLVISAVSNYDYSKLKYWVNSLNSCGFKGRKAIIAHNISDKTIEQLKDNDIEVWLTSSTRNKENNGFHFADNFSYQVPLARHYFHWMILSQMKDIRYVISTDCTDVIFQTNPSTWLEKNIGNKKLNYGCESLKYKDEEWGYNNMLTSFGPVIQNYMAEKPIYNAGSMAGEFNTFKDFSLNVFLACQHSQEPMPDQASVNLILSLEPYKSITKFNDHDTNWACECGTTADPSKMDKFRPKLLSPEPKFDGEYVYTSKNEKYVMVHQYNRVFDWKDKIEAKYENRI